MERNLLSIMFLLLAQFIVANDEVNCFYAVDATIEGGLRLYDADKGKKATIHGWNSVGQRIMWTAHLQKGCYKVLLNCSEPYRGSAVALTVGKQQLASLIKPTGSWSRYENVELGIIKVEKSGQTEIILQGIQLALKKNEKGKEQYCEALPDVCFLSLAPTKEKATSQTVDILQQFRGKRIFDGKTFSGWEGNDGERSMALFRIEDGCIVGGRMDKGIFNNEFLRTKKQYGDFELRLKYRMVCSDDSYNGGVQLRSIPATEKTYEMVGYQADIISWKLGALYDEQRRWDFLGTPLGKPNPYCASDWNEYVIRCEGRRVRIWLNGVQTLDFIEPDENIPMSGHIAVQIHEGKPCEAWYKDIYLQEL